ncbi:hypothetical protein H6P81_003869 [Aristolochia fimbriata]|uniref:Uncharacterized protein n=1 Tax=Aristolochia fimbriata TaxID=158543 RepID=A0AAV7FH75_ARIFI|nr:hypothetical protein H6P81_003869 [Aristolochia fimbriata]
MSLVDYASSSEDEEEKETVQEENEDGKQQKEPLPPPDSQSRNLTESSNHQSDGASSSSVLPEKLPDASLLLNLSAFPSNLMNPGDHSSRVTAAMAESVSRKREPNGLAFPHQQSKLPRGNMPNSKSTPDTLEGMLIPPQLRGRSNVVTEDIGRLFVNRRS